jgi:hypothetical protein
MSQENIEIVRRGLQDLEAFRLLLDENVVWDLRAMPIIDLPEVVVGRDAVIEARGITGALGLTIASTRKNSSMQGRALSSSSGRSSGKGKRRSSRAAVRAVVEISPRQGHSIGAFPRTKPKPSKPPGWRSRRCRKERRASASDL